MVSLASRILGAQIEPTPSWLVRPGELECKKRWPLITQIYGDLTGLELPTVMRPVERRTVDAVLRTEAGSRILEVDEEQHFNEFRARTLRHYMHDVSVAFDPQAWLEASDAKTQLEGGGFGAPKPPLFPGPGGRHRQRAFRDALTDLLPAEHGFLPTLRVAYFEVEDWINDPDSEERFETLLRDRLRYPRAPNTMELILGAGRIDRRISDVARLLRDWREKERDWGQLYLEYEPITPRDRVLVEDLAVTMLINSRVDARAATSVARNGAALDLASLPEKALEETTDEDRQFLAQLIGTMTTWPGIGASVATKTLHKKRPRLIPVLDNRAIFGAYMNPHWPERRPLGETIKTVARIKEALEWIAEDVARPENEATWRALQSVEPDRSRIELFDMTWWMYLGRIEERRRSAASAQEQ